VVGWFSGEQKTLYLLQNWVPMNKIKAKILYRLQKFQIESQTQSLQNAPAYLKVLAWLYKIMGRKLLAKSLVSTSRCNGCNLCVSVCPHQAIQLKQNNPRRKRKCKGCFLCVYSCPQKVFELPVISLVGAVVLLFLPYDNWLTKIFGLDIVRDWKHIINMVLLFVLWCVGYAIAVFVFERLVSWISIFPFFKKLGETSLAKKMRNKIHPALIFPALVYSNPKKTNAY
jgi:ferredoxin